MKQIAILVTSLVTVATSLLVGQGQVLAATPSVINFNTTGAAKTYKSGTTIMESPHQNSYVRFSADCNLIVYHFVKEGVKVVKWQSHTGGYGGNCYLQLGGAAVKYNHIAVEYEDTAGNFPLWTNKLSDNLGNPDQLVLSDSGVLTQYATDDGGRVAKLWQVGN